MILNLMTTSLTPAPHRRYRDPRGADGPAHVQHVVVTLPCAHCLGDVAGNSFRYLSSMRRLVHAQCPSCRRWMTLSVANWRRWTASPPRHPADRLWGAGAAGRTFRRPHTLSGTPVAAGSRCAGTADRTGSR
jgi:hypothetical protein